MRSHQLCRSGGLDSSSSNARPFIHARCTPANVRICRVGAGRSVKHQAPQISSRDLSAASRYAMSGLALAVVGSMLVEPAIAADIASTSSTMPMEQFQLAEGQEFWGNVLRYGRYFVTVMLGTGYVMLRPFTSAFKNPVSAILAIAGLAGSVLLVKFTLEAMLGIGNDLPFDYVQGSF